MPMYEYVTGGALRPVDGPYEVLSDGVTLSYALDNRDNGVLVVPEPPAILATSAMLTNSSAQINWSAPAGDEPVTGYELFRDDVLVAQTLPTVLTYTETGLPTSGSPVFAYKVRAYGAFEASPFSAVYPLQWSGTPTPPPDPPFNLTVSGVTSDSAVLNWQEPTPVNIAGRRVRYGTGVLLKQITGNVRTTTLTGLAQQTAYPGVYVTVYNTDGVESGPSNTRSFTTLGTTPSSRETVPGQVVGKTIWGMATDNYTARVAETGPVSAEHSFVSTWSPSTLLQKVRDLHADGLLPYMGMKVHGGEGGLSSGSNLWQQVANGALDFSCTAMANQLGALGYPIRLGFHHEPGGNPDGSGAEGGTLRQWAAMQIRLFNIIKPLAPNVVVGPIDNGFKWSSGNQGFTDAQLNDYYSDEFLDAMMVHGADYYDGATTRTNGERASIKAANAAAWLDRRGFNKPQDSGEWQFVRPADHTSMLNLCTADPNRWWLMIAFNSDTNNRANIPTIGGGWNFTHGYDTATDRLNAFKAGLADPLTA